MRVAVAILTALCAFAADIAVRREGPSFRISGAASNAEVALYVGQGDVPPVLGSLSSDGADLLFRPRYELLRTIAARVVVNGQTFHFPAEADSLAASTRVERVYPTSDEIPANQLKFYIHFSAPMLPGEAWPNLRLLDAQGRAVDLPFIEIDQELWDRDTRRLTVLFDPGRIKRGVLPREEIGPSLEAGKSYTLEVDRAWRDSRRVPLALAFRKTFNVIAEDRTAIDPAKWRVTPPKPGTREPLTIDFGESLDAALALRLITVSSIKGEAALDNAERGWRYVPAEPWPFGKHEIVIDTALEDLAGNRVGRPFDVDTFDPITVRSGRSLIRLPFRVE